MRGRLRYLLALAFLVLFGVLPAPDATTGKPYVAYLQVRAWLVGDDSPLRHWVRDGAVPALAVDLVQSPPIEDPDLAEQRRDEFARIATEWARGRGLVVDAARSLPLAVQIGSDGVRATLPRPDGSPAQHDALFPTRAALLPAALAIAVALLTHRVVLALLLAGLAGAVAFVAQPGGLTAVPGALWPGLTHFAVDTFWARAICQTLYVRITLFVVFLFMTVAVLTRNGGMQGLVALLQRRVRGPVSAQLTAYATGLLIFFDDYTNCMVVGAAMRPLCDAERVSREKLAYVVDSTAAPVAGLSLVSTWVTYEVSMFSAPLQLVTDASGRPYAEADAYGVFVATLPYRFYCVLALLLVPLVALLRRDFGPMLAAERRARASVATAATTAEEPTAPPAGAVHALLPMGMLTVGAATAMLGFDVRSDVALFGAAVCAYATAVAMSLGARLLSPAAILRASVGTLRTLVPAFAILFLAWSLGEICRDLGTSFFLCAGARGAMVAQALPVVLFAVSGVIAFATGTSFGTMSILLPNVVLLAHQLGTDAAFLGDPARGGPALMLLSIGAVLEGSIFGDHCSPISDTTVLSSVGSRCDHLAHVSTQLPYALLCAAVAMVCGYLPMVLIGPSWWPLSYAAALTVFVVVLLRFGRDPGKPVAEATVTSTS